MRGNNDGRRRQRQGTTLPLPKFYFSIDLGDGKEQGFAEVSGLEAR
jgi:hypothetical protein